MPRSPIQSSTTKRWGARGAHSHACPSRGRLAARLTDRQRAPHMIIALLATDIFDLREITALDALQSHQGGLPCLVVPHGSVELDGRGTVEHSI